MPIKIERVSDTKSKLGEGPFWDESSQSLYYVDISGKTVNRYTPATKKHVTAVVGSKDVSFIIPIEGEENKFMIGHENELLKLTWDGASDKIGSLEAVAEVKDTPGRKHNFNDAKVSPTGQLWAGIYIHKGDGNFQPHVEAGSLYQLNSDKTLKELTSGITLTNGMAWNEKLNKFYYIDSFPEGVVYQFDYKPGELSNRKTIFNAKDKGIVGGPDGMTIDADGNLWIANFGGGKVIKIDPAQPNSVLQTIDIPSEQVTSVAFGGANYEDLYVTTATISAFGTEAPEGGWTYKVTGLGVKGLPARKVQF